MKVVQCPNIGHLLENFDYFGTGVGEVRSFFIAHNDLMSINPHTEVKILQNGTES